MRSETNSDLSNEPRPGSTPTDGYLTLGQAAATLPGRPHLSTLHRWRLRGVRGVRLRTCLVGGRRFTRREWLSEGRKLVLAPLLKRQRDALRSFEDTMRAYGPLGLEYDKAVLQWKKSKTGEPPPEPPEKPEPIEFVVADATVEAMIRVLNANPRGVLLERDELAAWLGSFDKYSAGKGDAQNWINAHAAGYMKTNRAGLAKPLFVERGAVSVSGTIQPAILTAALAGEHTASGFAARLLMAEPPRRVKRWTDQDVSSATERAWADRLLDLLDLDFAAGAEGDPYPLPLPLAAEALERFKVFVNEHGAAGLDRDGAELAAWSKLEGYAARLALVMQLIDDPDAIEVSDAWLAAGIELARWFGNEAARFYSGSKLNPEDRENAKLVAWIGSRGGTATAREVQQGLRSIKTAAEAEMALNRLAEARHGDWRVVPTATKQRREFVLSTPSTSTDSPETRDLSECVDVDTVDSLESSSEPEIDADGWEVA